MTQLEKLFKYFLWLAGAVVALLLCFSLWYVIKFYPRAADPFEVNSPALEKKLLIATQSSEFKDRLVGSLVAEYAHQNVYIKVIDVSQIGQTTAVKWWGIVIINSSLMDKINAHVQTSLNSLKRAENIVVVTTSGGGDFVPTGLKVDGITTASKLSAVDDILRQIRNLLRE